MKFSETQLVNVGMCRSHVDTYLTHVHFPLQCCPQYTRISGFSCGTVFTLARSLSLNLYSKKQRETITSFRLPRTVASVSFSRIFRRFCLGNWETYSRQIQGTRTVSKSINSNLLKRQTLPWKSYHVIEFWKMSVWDVLTKTGHVCYRVSLIYI